MTIEISYNPYCGTDWNDEQGYYEFHAHIREHELSETETHYEAAGYRGLVVGDDPCRDDHDQVHFYWPWKEEPSSYDEFYDDGLVGIPGGEYGDHLQHVIAINTQHELDCEIDEEDEMVARLVDDPEIQGVPCVLYITHPDELDPDDMAQLASNEPLVLDCDGWHRESEHYWDEYHAVLDFGIRRWWHFASDDYSYNRQDELDATRNYLILDEHTPQNVIDALISGSFYTAYAPDLFIGTNDFEELANHPPEFDEIRVDHDAKEIEVIAEQAEKCEWISSGGTVLHDGFSLPYGEYDTELDTSWAYPRIESDTHSRAAAQPFSFDSPTTMEDEYTQSGTLTVETSEGHNDRIKIIEEELDETEWTDDFEFAEGGLRLRDTE